MRLKKNLYINRIINICFIAALLISIGYQFITITYATQNQANPDFIITINDNGSISNTGSLFGKDLWYPSMEKDGIIRIYNNFKKVKVTGMGLNITLNDYQREYSRDEVMNSFLNSMELTLEKGKFLIFQQKILDRVKFSQLVNNSMNDIFKGYILEKPHSFNISKSDFIDLKYTLRMDISAGPETQNIDASVEFIFEFEE
ncbi:MAG TPA: hypothetical protein GXX37_06700 [Clostridiaceae bacterium]|nr:hypothetical protein [Clostridiaceae bacterium]